MLKATVMLPTVIKQALALYAGCVHRFPPHAKPGHYTAAGPPTMANERSTYLDVYG